ncbi:CHAT domain-containing protein [Dyella sp. LX-1]|uniref:CHAT domain-containing protein n=1 Tax=unclassified Dyella TaxID=2634549 RepID=UPI0031F2DE50
MAIQKKKAAEIKRILDINSRILSVQEAARKASSVSAFESRLRDIARYQRDVASSEKKVADFEKNIGQLQARIAEDQRRQADEEQREGKRRIQDESNRMRQQTQHMAAVDSTLRHHSALHRRTEHAIAKLLQPLERIVVLFLASNPIDQQQLRLDEEARSIGQMIRGSKHRDVVKLETRWALQSSDLLQALNECQPTIVHFSGHGSDQDEIIFQSPSGQAKSVSKEAIVQVMKTVAENIRLVFFNTCYSHGQAEAVVEHIEAAIGMNTSIGDEAARVFSSNFYSAIGFGLSVRKAFDQARAALMLEGIPEHDTPILFVQAGLDADEIVLVTP